jgi:hypothetical protein
MAFAHPSFLSLDLADHEEDYDQNFCKLYDGRLSDHS